MAKKRTVQIYIQLGFRGETTKSADSLAKEITRLTRDLISDGKSRSGYTEAIPIRVEFGFEDSKDAFTA